MWSLRVVESFDIFKDGKLKFLQRVVGSPVYLFLLEILEERFAADVIVGGGILSWRMPVY